MRFCARCGADVSGTVCGLCGSTDIEEAPAPPAPANWVPRAPSVPAATSAAQPPPPAALSPATYQPHRQGGGRVLPVVLVVLVALVVILALVAGRGSNRSSDIQAAGSQTTMIPRSAISTPAHSATPKPTPTVDPEVAAQAELDQMIAENRSRVPLNGQFAAMLAGKWVGIEDPLQVNAEGSHVFGAADILAEHNAIKARVSGVQLVLLDSRTFGNHIDHQGKPLYVTIGLSSSFHDRDSVLAWCAQQFPEFSGDELLNRCTSTRLAA